MVPLLRTSSMHSHDSASAPETSDPIPGDGDRLPPVRRSFPVPKRKTAVIEDEEEEGPAEFDRPAWGIRALLALAVIMAGAAAWITFRPGGGREPKSASTVPANAAEPRREISQDPAVEIYFTRSTPAPQEPGGELEPSTQPAVATPQTPPASPGAGKSPAPREEEGVFEIRNDDLPK